MKEQNYILLILNCHKYRNKAIIQKKLWLRNLHPQIIYYHIIGDQNRCGQQNAEYIIDDDEHIIYTNTKDDYNSLPWKIMTAIKCINENYKYKYILKTDDDQFLQNNNFFSGFIHVLESNSYHYGGLSVNVNDHISTYNRIHPELPNNLLLKATTYCNGRFYFLSANAVNNLVPKIDKIKQHIIEDHAIGFYLDTNFKKNIYHFDNSQYFVDYNPTVSAELMGGLGNQIFQIFATIAYAFRYNRVFVFQYLDQLGSRKTYWNDFLKELKVFTQSGPVNFPTIRETNFHYNLIPNKPNTIKLSGYFQSPKYFKDKYQEIIEMINLREQQKWIKEKYQDYFTKPCISVHFRIGDYKEKQQYHPVLNNIYYQNAIRQIIDRINKNDWNVIYHCEKDDIPTVENNIRHLSAMYPDIQFIKVRDEIPDWEQMLMMSLCNHNIMANSTFSWWGAYFNENPDKIICYPKTWFGPALMPTHNTGDLFEPDWIAV